MKQIKKNSVSEIKPNKNPIKQMIADQKSIAKAIEKGENLSTLKEIKIVSPLISIQRKNPSLKLVLLPFNNITLPSNVKSQIEHPKRRSPL